MSIRFSVPFVLCLAAAAGCDSRPIDDVAPGLANAAQEAEQAVGNAANELQNAVEGDNFEEFRSHAKERLDELEAELAALEAQVERAGDDVDDETRQGMEDLRRRADELGRNIETLADDGVGEAREERDEAREAITQGLDESESRLERLLERSREWGIDLDEDGQGS